jgi:hypothetical protein
MHRILHASKTAWQLAAQRLCDIIASVTTDMEALCETIARTEGPPAPSTGTLPSPARFLTLATIPATMATVMLHNSSPDIAVSADLGRRQLTALLTFQDLLLPAPSGVAAATTMSAAADAGQRTCMQLVAAWLALLHRITPLPALAALMEHSCECPRLAFHLPTQHLHELLNVDRCADSTVASLVHKAFSSVLLAHGETFLPSSVEQRSCAAGGRPARVPLWLALIGLLSVQLQVDFVPTATIDSSSAWLNPSQWLPSPSVRLQTTAWSALTAFAPMLAPIASFCDPSPVETSGSTNPWATACWLSLLARVQDILPLPSNAETEYSRAIASFLLAVVTIDDSRSARQAICDSLVRSAAALCHADSNIHSSRPSQGLHLAGAGAGSACIEHASKPESSTGMHRANTTAHHRFDFLFALHLLQTSLRWQGLSAACLRHFACCLADMLSEPVLRLNVPSAVVPGGQNGTESTILDTTSKATKRLRGAVGCTSNVNRTDLCGGKELPLSDAVPVAAVAANAAQQACSVLVDTSDAELAAAVTFIFSHCARLLLACLAQVDSHAESDATTAVAFACATAEQLRQLAPLVPTRFTTAIIMHATDLLLLTMLRVAGASNTLVTLEIGASAPDPLPGEDPPAASPAADTGALKQPAQELLKAAVQLLASAVGQPVLRAPDAVARIAALCTSGMALLANVSADAFADVLKTLPAVVTTASGYRGLPADVLDMAGAAGLQPLRDAEAAAKASTRMLQDAVVKSPRPTRVHINAAFALLKELLQAIGTGNNTATAGLPAKVLVSTGNSFISLLLYLELGGGA